MLSLIRKEGKWNKQVLSFNINRWVGEGWDTDNIGVGRREEGKGETERGRGNFVV